MTVGSLVELVLRGWRGGRCGPPTDFSEGRVGEHGWGRSKPRARRLGESARGDRRSGGGQDRLGKRWLGAAGGTTVLGGNDGQLGGGQEA
jgi:hypothetical protein